MSTNFKKKEVNTLKVLLNSLKFQLIELNEVNQKIEKLNSNKNGGKLKEREERIR